MQVSDTRQGRSGPANTDASIATDTRPVSDADRQDGPESCSQPGSKAGDGARTAASAAARPAALSRVGTEAGTKPGTEAGTGTGTGSGTEDRASASLQVGVDVGGTFTDLIMLDPADDTVRFAKVPSTLDNQADGVLAALQAAGVELAEVVSIVHGTTTTTNAVLERKLSRTGLITTRGFRDVLELGRRTRPRPYGMQGRFEPLIPRDLRVEVSERLEASGRVRKPLDEAGVARAVEHLLAAGCESLVVHFLHAYANPEHERRAVALARALWPNAHVTAGHELLSENREFERGVTAAVNASVQPMLARYIDRLINQLATRGYGGELLVVNGNGGMVAASNVAREAAKTVMSGPASGVMAAAWTGARAGRPNLITYDMGGTSTDVALIRDARPSVTSETELEYGMPIHVPMVDVRTVGAGGGSIARITPGGLLSVGPDSAGSDPGPICYGRGGTAPTLSDANVLLGRLNPSSLPSVDGAQAASRIMENLHACFSRVLGEPLGLDAMAAAAAVVHVADTRMAGAVRMVSVSLGVDPRDFSLFAFGGAGPLHAVSIARELGIPTVLVPPRPGITNALGCLVAELRHDFVDTINQPLDTLDAALVHERFAARIAEGRARIESQSANLDGIRVELAVDMQFVGQTHLLRVQIDTPSPDAEFLQQAFERAYDERFRVTLDDIRANLVNIAVSVIGERARQDVSGLLEPAERAATLAAACIGERDVFLDGLARRTPVYRRERIPLTARLDGPAIVEQMDTTTLIPPGAEAVVDEHANLIIHVDAVFVENGRNTAAAAEATAGATLT